jgi:PrtD family type I secretion system ABC transporter
VLSTAGPEKRSNVKEFFKKWKKFFIFAGLFSLFINLLQLTFPIYMMAIYDKVLTSYSMETLTTLTVGALFAYAISALLDFLRSRLLVRAGVDMDRSLSRPVFEEMVRDAARLKRHGYSQGLRDVSTLRNYFGGNAIFFIFDAPWIPISLVIIYLLHPVLGMTATAGALITLILGLAQEFTTRRRLNDATAANGQGQNLVSVGLRNAEVVNSMGMLPGLIDTWGKKNNEVIQLQTEASDNAGVLQSISKSLRQSMQVIIYGVGAYLVLQGEGTAGMIIAASIIMGRALAPIDQAMATWKMTVEARGAYRRLNAVMQAIQKRPTLDLPAPTGKLAVEGASVAVEGKFILRNITFTLEPGDFMALIGPSAAGKTTLCRVILGLWPSMGGKVRLDGADVFEWESEKLGPHIGYLPQDVELFPGTVSANIARLSEPDSEKVVAAAKMAGVHELILSLPKGYDTDIGEAGRNLSGGQRQRIGLARALYGEPKLVILDEPNSNLDDVGEAALLRALLQLKQRKATIIVVTHKPAILSSVDKILMLSDGQMAMFGPRQEVLARLTQRQQPQQARPVQQAVPAAPQGGQALGRVVPVKSDQGKQ